jgi:hypothetical protein
MGLPGDACDAYARQVVALEQLQRSGLGVMRRLAPFKGMSDEEIITALQDASARLEQSLKAVSADFPRASEPA